MLSASLQALYSGVLKRERRALARTITLLESTRPDHEKEAQHLLAALMPHTGGAVRLGLSGVPGVGKSTLTEALGMFLVERGHRVAVLAVDPSSERTGGSIMGDKTRMPRLSTHPQAFVRPSPSQGTLGGVARRTREALLACEAAGYDVVLIETVGVGQSETSVANMTDTFALLTLPNAGDELQGVKRGIMERADLLIVNKADHDPAAARRARTELIRALGLLVPHGASWTPPVLQVSALHGSGVAEVWEAVLSHRLTQDLPARRAAQTGAWFDVLIQERVWQAFLNGVDLERLAGLRDRVQRQDITVVQGVEAALGGESCQERNAP